MFRSQKTRSRLKHLGQLLFVVLPLFATWRALVPSSLSLAHTQRIFAVTGDYHWFFFILSAPIYWLIIEWLFRQFHLLLHEILRNHWGYSNLESTRILAPGLLAPWRTSLHHEAQLHRFWLTSWLSLPVLAIVALVLFQINQLVGNFQNLAGYTHWATLDHLGQQLVTFYEIILLVLLPHIWLRTIQYMEITHFVLKGGLGTKQDWPRFVHPDRWFGLSRSWRITVAMALTVLLLGVGWLVAAYLTAGTLGLIHVPHQMTKPLLALLCFYSLFSASSFLPLAWSYLANKRRKHEILLPWRILESELRTSFLSHHTNWTPAKLTAFSSTVSFVRGEIESLEALPELPVPVGKVFSFIAVQMIPAILSIILLVRQLLAP